MQKKDFKLMVIANNATHENPFQLAEDLTKQAEEKGYFGKAKSKDLTVKHSLPDLFKEKIVADNEFLIKLKEDFNIDANYFKAEMDNFLAYRNEKWEWQRKHRWEKEKTFEVRQRFIRWLSNKKPSQNKIWQWKQITI